MAANTGAKGNKLSLNALILMIFTSVFGFANIPRSFFLMGYGAIPWYIISGITFFVPFAFMMAEYGSAFKNEKGGIYSWMEKSVNAKYAFVGTFMWYASYIVWMVSVSSSIMIPLTNGIFGHNMTQKMGIAGLAPTQVLGIIGVCWMLLVTFVGSRGLDKIKKVTSIGGLAVMGLNIFLLVGSLLVLVLNGFELAQPISSFADFTTSPNPKYGSFLSVLSFLVFALFAYGGIEVVGGLVDQTENAEKNFPKGIIMAAAVISIGYSVGIFLIGISTNWAQVLTADGVHMGTVAYVTMSNLGYQLALAFGAGTAAATTAGAMVARFMGISMFLALSGAFFTLTYAPLKQIIDGTPKALWPGKMGEMKDGMPVNAMWVQCGIAVAMIILVSFGGEGAAAFFTKLTLMTNVAMTIPYMFIAGAFAAFKMKDSIPKPFIIFKSKAVGIAVSIIVTFTVGFANFFTIIEPAMNGDLSSTIWMIGGPIFFALVAVVMYSNYERKLKANPSLKEQSVK
jgi:amino acid transporter